jgi:hypothetical protein
MRLHPHTASSSSTGQSFTSINEFYAAFFMPVLFAYHPLANPHQVQAVPRNTSPSVITNARNTLMDITNQSGITGGEEENFPEGEEDEDD